MQQVKDQPRVLTRVSQSVSEFRAAISESFVPVHITSDRPDHFWGRIHSSSVDQIHVAEVSAARHIVQRTPELIAQGDRRYYKLSVQLAGSGLLVQDDREALLQAGDLAVYDTHRPYSFIFDGDFRSTEITFPQHLIDLPTETMARLTAVRMSGKEGIASVILPFIGKLAENLESFSASTDARLARSAIDLISTMFTTELGLDRNSPNSHNTLMHQIRQHIEANLASTELGPSRIAAAHFISTRHLHGIFREHGTTVSSLIRSLRLERCRNDLLDPQCADRTVSSIASRWGFADAAHFSRVFKETYGQSPSNIRRSTAD